MDRQFHINLWQFGAPRNEALVELINSFKLKTHKKVQMNVMRVTRIENVNGTEEDRIDKKQFESREQ